LLIEGMFDLEIETSADVVGEAVSLTFMLSEVSRIDLSSGLVLEDNIT
jgi:hypothetical protein